jgi:hypothetical protein
VQPPPSSPSSASWLRQSFLPACLCCSEQAPAQPPPARRAVLLEPLVNPVPMMARLQHLRETGPPPALLRRELGSAPKRKLRVTTRFYRKLAIGS